MRSLLLSLLLLSLTSCPLLWSASAAGSISYVDPTQWNYGTGYTYTLYSYAAYCPYETLDTWTCKWCQANETTRSFQTSGFFNDRDTNTYGYAGYNTDLEQIIVAFRGTEMGSLKNWITDLKYAKLTPLKSYPNVSVHDGFYQAWKNLSPQVMPVVQALHQQFANYDVVVTGHSLGAALATLCMVELAENNIPAYIWDYGRPRVGNQPFSMLSMQSAKASFRHVNQRDTVPHLPLEAMGFFHAPTEVWYHENEWRVCDPTNGEDRTCSDSQYFDTSISDHLHYFNLYESCSSKKRTDDEADQLDSTPPPYWPPTADQRRLYRELGLKF
mmetsp:Transcript_10439/g.26259  ORF Transcript_10439/g.26259 Transcript_10439/m.26259 type:complete len:328 (-) Transcript_10439:76-1059(-)